jgi:MFS family permease
MLFLVKEEKQKSAGAPRPAIRISFRGMDPRLKVFFAAVFIFTLGNSSNQFLLLKTMDAGISLPDMLLMYMLFNLTTSLLSTPLGSISDRVGRKRIILAGYCLYSFIYIMFGFAGPGTRHYLWFFWILYGVYYALTEGIEKALVADLAPAESRGTTMGLFNTITGIGLLPASIIAGFLYSWSPQAPFIFGGIMSGIGFGLIAIFLRERKGNS